MNGTYDYILQELKNSKMTSSAIYKKLKKVEKRNRNLTVLALSLTLYMIVSTVNYNDACRKIDALSDELLELREKGV